MNELFKNKYRVNSTRILGRDYSLPGRYYVTICTEDKKMHFGTIKQGRMILSNIGKIADKFWRDIPNHFGDVNLDEHVVMPNHVHGIINIINEYFGKDAINNIETWDI